MFTFSLVTVNAVYFRVTKFSRLAAQKHIRGLLNSRWADAHLWHFGTANIFAGFLIRALLNSARNTRKLMYRDVFPLLQLFKQYFISTALPYDLIEFEACA